MHRELLAEALLEPRTAASLTETCVPASSRRTKKKDPGPCRIQRREQSRHRPVLVRPSEGLSGFGRRTRATSDTPIHGAVAARQTPVRQPLSPTSTSAD